ncbi:hypothetical protein [Chitinivibrio alkaliphilus]|uniref:PhaC PHA synthase n=1 Tax=Chitinivibrio alkaliphilus ACht1 TaxID=1313304 RepID=U7D663_9BACT|nr:hypothetical protein [Chitinivibrio alkaliphilus]ERP31066.1 hypothetical protein CALK_2024 [Chitinivibrio alkaliphilus ACht1]
MKKALFMLAICTSMIMANKVELGLVSPIQIGGPTENVDGLRLGLLYTKNNRVNGVDINLFVGHTTSDFDGFRFWGLANINEGSTSGFSLFTGVNLTGGNSDMISLGSWANITQGSAQGARIFSVVNYADSFEGFDWGFVNIGQRVTGIQFGVINYATQLDGIQIGLGNIARNSAVFPVLPLVNFSKSF